MERPEDDRLPPATNSTDTNSRLSPDSDDTTDDLPTTSVSTSKHALDNLSSKDDSFERKSGEKGFGSNLQSVSSLSQSLSSVYMMAKMSARSKHVIRDARDSGRLNLIQVWQHRRRGLRMDCTE